MPHKTVYTTERGEFHQERAITSAPPELEVVMLRQPSDGELIAKAVDAVYFISERTGVISADLLAKMPNLKLILRLGSMTYDIDTAAAKSAGVVVCYQPVLGVIRVAETYVYADGGPSPSACTMSRGWHGRQATNGARASAPTRILSPTTGRIGRGSGRFTSAQSGYWVLARSARSWRVGFEGGDARCCTTSAAACRNRSKLS